MVTCQAGACKVAEAVKGWVRSTPSDSPLQHGNATDQAARWPSGLTRSLGQKRALRHRTAATITKGERRPSLRHQAIDWLHMPLEQKHAYVAFM